MKLEWTKLNINAISPLKVNSFKGQIAFMFKINQISNTEICERHSDLAFLFSACLGWFSFIFKK